MKATELRIGNVVKRNEVVVTCDFMSAANCYSIPEQYEPIPLTEEWLLKFNPSACPNAAYLFESEIGGVWIEKFIDDKYYLTDDEANMLSFIEIKYVHQLQNIYHSLTGEELAITTQ
jgi:hypothetical protein